MGKQVLACYIRFDVVGGPNLRGVPKEDEKRIGDGGLSSFSLIFLDMADLTDRAAWGGLLPCVLSIGRVGIVSETSSEETSF